MGRNWERSEHGHETLWVGDDGVRTVSDYYGSGFMAGHVSLDEFLEGRMQKTVAERFGAAVLAEAIAEAKLLRARRPAPAEDPVPYVSIRDCAICADLPDSVNADLRLGEALPPAAAALVVVEHKRRNDFFRDGPRRCPRCGTYYHYRHEQLNDHYIDPSVDEYLSRSTPFETLEFLRENAPIEAERLERRLRDVLRDADAVIAAEDRRYLTWARRTMEQSARAPRAAGR